MKANAAVIDQCFIMSTMIPVVENERGKLLKGWREVASEKTLDYFFIFFCYLFVILLFLRFFNQLEEPLRYFVGVLEVAFHFAFQEFSLCFTSLHFMSDLDRKMGVRKPIILMAIIFLRNIMFVLCTGFP